MLPVHRLTEVEQTASNVSCRANFIKGRVNYQLVVAVQHFDMVCVSHYIFNGVEDLAVGCSRLVQEKAVYG